MTDKDFTNWLHAYMNSIDFEEISSKELKMKIGDKFKFNIELMEKNNINIDDKDVNSIQTVMDVLEEKDLGTIIGYKLLCPDCPGRFVQINECWCIPEKINNNLKINFMNLYLITTEKLGDFYLVEKTPNDAQEKLSNLLNKSDYSFSYHRKVINIKLLAEELDEFPVGKPNFSSGNRLILPSSCINEPDEK